MLGLIAQNGQGGTYLHQMFFLYYAGVSVGIFSADLE